MACATTSTVPCGEACVCERPTGGAARRVVPEEQDILAPEWGYDEDWVFALVCKLAGVAFRALDEADYELLAMG
jgi:hypothetical protein